MSVASGQPGSEADPVGKGRKQRRVVGRRMDDQNETSGLDAELARSGVPEYPGHSVDDPASRGSLSRCLARSTPRADRRGTGRGRRSGRRTRTHDLHLANVSRRTTRSHKSDSRLRRCPSRGRPGSRLAVKRPSRRGRVDERDLLCHIERVLARPAASSPEPLPRTAAARRVR